MVKVRELIIDIKNPQVDRRSKDWNKLPVLTKGQRFTLHEGRTIDYIYSSDHHYCSEYVTNALGKLILASSIEVEPKTFTEFSRVYDCDMSGSGAFAEALFKLGRLKAEDFEAVRKYYNELEV